MKKISLSTLFVLVFVVMATVLSFSFISVWSHFVVAPSLRWSYSLALALLLWLYAVLLGLVTIYEHRKRLLDRGRYNKKTLFLFIIIGFALFAFFAAVLSSLFVPVIHDNFVCLLADVLVYGYVSLLSSCFLVSYLERGRQLDDFKSLLDKNNIDSSSLVENTSFFDRGGKLVFSTRKENVLYIEAADNYTNIHYLNDDKEDTFILHNSMKQIEGSALYPYMLRCHRGFMVNVLKVKLLRRDKDGLLLELSSCQRPIPVSRTYADKVVAQFFTEEHD